MVEPRPAEASRSQGLLRNLALSFASLVLVLGGLELWLRLHPPTELQTNNEYAYRQTIGKRSFLVPYHE